MAIALENSNLVAQKVKAALTNANPAIQNQYIAFKSYFAQQKGNPDLQFIPFTSTNVLTTGYAATDAACTVYAVFTQKAGTGTTAGYLNIIDGASGNTGARLSSVYHKTVGDQSFNFVPSGMAIATALSIFDTTAATGTTVTTGASDAVQGFVVIGA